MDGAWGLSRRRFLHGAGAVALAGLVGCERLPFVQRAPPPPKLARVGYLAEQGGAPGTQFLQVFREGLRDHGYVEGRNLLLETRIVDAPSDRLGELAAELVALPVDVLVASPAPAAIAASQVTTTVPIVIGAGGGDPVAFGLADSLARPGRNVTGLSAMSATLSGKRVEYLREVIPDIARVAVVTDGRNPSGAAQLRYTQEAAIALGLDTVELDLRGPGGIDAVLDGIVRERADAVSVLAVNVTFPEYTRLAELCVANRLPSMVALRSGVEAGALMMYAPNQEALIRRAANYVHRIVQGANPAEMPIEQPTTIEFILNHRTARAIGLTIPHHVLLQVTEGIQ